MEEFNQDQGDTAIIVCPFLHSLSDAGLDDQVEEAEGLARAIYLDVIETRVIKLSKPTPGYLLGKGHREEIAERVEELQPTIVIVNHNLTPVQQRNLERQWHAKVIDRTGLILEIFGERAQTKEGRIQVELAALEYQRSRLVRSWTHLERQRGGAGFMGGPGETQIEIDRRIIGDRITKLKKDLEHVRKTRDLQRRSREQVPFPIVALVGYTNAGKSTLFNTLTGADVFAEDLPFATLDPTLRKLTLENGMDVILSDTVGFIADLPTTLVAAFRATLEQVQYADVILHIRDVSRPDHESQKRDVIEIMEELGIEYEQDPRIIEVLNKVDALEEDDRKDILRKAQFTDNYVAISALKKTGLQDLLGMVENFLSAGRKLICYDLKTTDGQALAWLYEHATIENREDGTKYIRVEVEISPEDIGRFKDRHDYSPLENEDDQKHETYGH